jgi:homoserine dehydrogenase
MMPTASAVVADMLDLAANPAFRMRTMRSPSTPPLPMSDVVSKYYLRLEVIDKPGVLAKLTGILGDCQVSIVTLLQKGIKDHVAELILITDQVRESQLQDAIHQISTLDVVKNVANVIRVGL